MTVSTVTVSQFSKRKLIYQAATIAGVKRRGQALDSEDYEVAEIQLEAILTHWQAQGLNQSLSQMATLILEPNKKEYLLGTTAHCSETVYKYTTNGAKVTGNTTITLNSVDGLSVNDVAGIWLGTSWQWTTISSISSLDVTLSDSLTADLASGSKVWFYTSKIARPLRVKDAYRDQQNVNVILNIKSRNEYFNLDLGSNGETVYVFYEPGRETQGKFYIWPLPPLNEPKSLLLHVQRPAFIPQANGDTLDLPQEWTMAVIYNLAEQCGLSWGVTGQNMQTISQKARDYYRQIRAFDREQDAILTLNPSQIR